MERPAVWQLIREAVQSLGGKASYLQIIEWIHAKYPDVNENTIRAQIIICAVNAPSRIHYPENKKPREANGKYDFLYSVDRGEVMFYDPRQHGKWAIIERDGQLAVSSQDTIDEEIQDDDSKSQEHVGFALEAHLRDFLAKNLETVESGLKLFRDENQWEGVEYPSSSGPIDILAKDKNGNFVVFELKVGRGADKAMGQLMRYMGWVKEKLASGKLVRGIVVAKNIDENLKYAVKVSSNVQLLEYEIRFAVKSVN